MSLAFLRAINNKSGVPLSNLEKLWENAKERAKSEYGVGRFSEDFNKLCQGMVIDSLGIESGNLIDGYHPIISRVHDLTGIPEPLLKKHWDTLEEAVSFSYNIKKTDKKYLPTVLKLFQTKINSLGSDFREALDPSFKRAIKGANASAKIKSPAQATPPIGINPEALIYWRQVIKTQRKRINAYTDNRDKWAAAIVLFKTLCAKKGVAPFMDNKKATETPKSPITSFLSSYVNPCLETIGKIEQFLLEKNMIGKRIPKRFTFDSINMEGNIRIINASKQWQLIKNEKAATLIVYMIPKFGLKKEAKGIFRKKCGPNASLLFSYKTKSDTALRVTIQLKVRKKYWKGLEETRKDPQKFIASWISRGFKATGQGDTAPLVEPPESNETLIKMHYSVSNSNEAIALINKFDISAIISLDDYDFQMAMARHIIRIAKKFNIEKPSLIEKFLTDADYRDYAREEYGTVLPDPGPETEGYPEGQIMAQ